MDKDKRREALGAISEPERQLIVLFIPSQDKNGKPVRDHSQWVAAAQKLLGQAFGGSTAMPPAIGTWYNEETGQLIEEEVRLIHSYASVVDIDDEEKMGALAEFLHRMGRETKQGEVALVIGRIFYRIRKYRKSEQFDA